MDPWTLALLGQGLFSLFGAGMQSNAAGDAAQMQMDAANRAAELMAQTQREALGLQRDIYNQTRTDQQPWIQAGQGSVNKLAHLMGIGMGGGGFTPLRAPAGAGGGANGPTGGVNEGSSGRQFTGTTGEPSGWLAAPRT